MAVGRSATAAADFGACERERVVQVTPGVKQICEGCFLDWTATSGLLVGRRSRATDRFEQGSDPLGGLFVGSGRAERGEVSLQGRHSGPGDGPGTLLFGR